MPRSRNATKTPTRKPAAKSKGKKRPRSSLTAAAKGADKGDANGNGPRRTRRRRQGAKAKILMNAERRRAHLKLAMPKAPFRRLIRRIIEELMEEKDNGIKNVSVHMKDDAKLVLQHGAEQQIIDIIEQADRLRQFCAKVRLTKDHLAFFQDQMGQSSKSIGGIVSNYPVRLGDGSFHDTATHTKDDEDAFDP